MPLRVRRVLLSLFLLLTAALFLFSTELSDFGRRVCERRFHIGAIHRAAARTGLNPKLIYAVVFVESRFRHRARSRKGAEGLMQVMPATAREVIERHDLRKFGFGKDDLDDHLTVGCLYLGDLMAEFGDTQTALAAYNGGPGSVKRWRKSAGADAGIESFPKPETRQYVRNILSTYRRIEVLETVWRWVRRTGRDPRVIEEMGVKKTNDQERRVERK